MTRMARIARLATATYPQPKTSGGGSGSGIGIPAPVQSLAGRSGTVSLSTPVSNATLIPFSGTPAALASLTIVLNPTITPPLGAFALKLLDFNGCDLSGITSIDVMAGLSVVNLDVQDPGGLWLFYFDGATLSGYQVDDNVPAPGAAGFDFVSTGPLLRQWVFQPPGGFQITSFSVTGAGVVEVGTTITDPPWSGAQNEVADTNTLAWTNPAGSEAVTPALSMTGAVPAVFTSNTNGAASALMLSGMKGATSSMKSTSITWAGSIVAGAETASPESGAGSGALQQSPRASGAHPDDDRRDIPDLVHRDADPDRRRADVARPPSDDHVRRLHLSAYGAPWVAGDHHGERHAAKLSLLHVGDDRRRSPVYVLLREARTMATIDELKRTFDAALAKLETAHAALVKAIAALPEQAAARRARADLQLAQAAYEAATGTTLTGGRPAPLGARPMRPRNALVRRMK